VDDALAFGARSAVGVAMIPLPMQYATTSDGVRIAYISLGDGPPLVFASNIFGELNGYRIGWPHTRDVTDRLVGLGWRVIRYDVRGMGSSDRDVEDLSLEGRVRDLAAVVGRLGLERFALAGVDIGAATAVAYTVQHHAAVSRLVLLSPWPSGARYLEIPQLRAAYAAETVATRDATLFANILGSVAMSFEDADLMRLRTEAHLHGTSPGGLAAYNAANERIDITHLLPEVRVPTLVIHEPAFPFGSFELCQEVAAGIPNAEFVIVRDNSITGRVHDEGVAALDQFLRTGTAAMGSTARASGEAPTRLPAASNGLTPREVQVLRQVAGGSTNKDIASELGVAVSTVERHLVNLYTKIGARGRADAIAYALRHRLGPLY
jgi:pimeloyl-ACP methyl ester carboxylesterase/DNA-binding CsgD family transcriptional regulator